MINSVRHLWESYLYQENFPTYIQEINTISLEDLLKTILICGDGLSYFISRFLTGDAIVVKGVIGIDTAQRIKQDVYNYGLTVPKTKTNPDTTIINNHRVRNTVHSYGFWRWNRDELNLFKQIDPFWKLIRMLNGLSQEEYTNNVPRDRIIEQVKVNYYPCDTGHVKTFCEPAKWQKTSIRINLNERGLDYENGGLYFLQANGEKMYAEDYMTTGDALIYVPTVFHGVDVSTEVPDVTLPEPLGKWDLDASVIQSYNVENRIKPVKYEEFLKDKNKVLQKYMFRD